MTDQGENRIELEPVERQVSIDSGIDRRPRMEQPLPVRLVAIADVTLPALVGQQPQLDRLYVDLLEFAKGPADDRIVIYHADNVDLRFILRAGLIERADYRPAMIEVQSLADAEHKLVDAEIEYTRQKTIAVGEESLLLQDPAGNWIEIVERREIR